MKTLAITFSLILSSFLLYSQSNALDWQKFETIVKAASSNPEVLSEKITAPFDNDRDKVMAIYYWVTHNIKYDVKLMKERAGSKPDKTKYTAADLEKKYQKDMMAALRKKKGVCQHYSQIFQALCRPANIECEFIGGYVKTITTRTGRKGRSHAWNAVKLDGEWELLDATFGSGALNQNMKFEFSFDPDYCFVNKDIFALNHFPNEDKWQLTDNLVDEETFKSRLNIGRGYLDYNIQNISHVLRKIKLAKGEGIDISFTSSKQIGDIKCYNMKSMKNIDFDISKDDLNYTLSFEKGKLRSGIYVFIVDREVLFNYQIVK